MTQHFRFYCTKNDVGVVVDAINRQNAVGRSRVHYWSERVPRGLSSIGHCADQGLIGDLKPKIIMVVCYCDRPDILTKIIWSHRGYNYGNLLRTIAVPAQKILGGQ